MTKPNRRPSGRRSDNSGDFRQENRTVLCDLTQPRRTAAKTAWRKSYFRHELHFSNSTSAAAQRWAAMRLPEAAQEIFVKIFSVGRIASRSATLPGSFHISWIFVLSNSKKANPRRRPPDRRCENGAEFSSRNWKRPRQNIAGLIRWRHSYEWNSLRCPLTAQICHGSVCGAVWIMSVGSAAWLTARSL